jgi:hypothetical protein
MTSRAERHERRVVLVLQLYTLDPRTIYAGLLWHALYDPHWKPWKKPYG